MNTMDNGKMIETIEKQTIMNYFDKLADAQMKKIVLFSVFPYTAAANLSDPHYFVLVEDVSRLASLNSGKANN